MSETEWLLKG